MGRVSGGLLVASRQSSSRGELAGIQGLATRDDARTWGCPTAAATDAPRCRHHRNQSSQELIDCAWYQYGTDSIDHRW